MKRLFIIMTVIITVFVVNNISLARQPLYKRNPFAALDDTPSSPAKPQRRWFVSEEISLCLNGIIWNKDNPVAIINDTVVKVGSEIFDRKVSAISPDHVELEYRGKQEFLKIMPKIEFAITNKKSAIKAKPKARP